jgi:hypothetical protein
MRIAFWASALLLLAVFASATAQESAADSASSAISYSTKNSKTRLDIRTPKGAHYILGVKRDSTVSPKSAPSDVKVVGEIKDSVVIIVDTYPSIPGSLSYCQAGEERFLRVISITKKPAKETFRVKLDSCRDNIELASPGIEWLPESLTLSIHWLQGPNKKQQSEDLTMQIGANGKPR